MKNITDLVTEAHSSRKILRPTAAGEHGYITDVRPTGIGTKQEALLIQMVVPGHKPGWFRWNTASSNGSYDFGKRILSDLSPEIRMALAQKDQLSTRIFIHSDAGWPHLKDLIGQKVRVTVKAGGPDNKGGSFPDEWTPNPLEHKPLSVEQVSALLAAVSGECEEEDPFS